MKTYTYVWIEESTIELTIAKLNEYGKLGYRKVDDHSRGSSLPPTYLVEKEESQLPEFNANINISNLPYQPSESGGIVYKSVPDFEPVLLKNTESVKVS